MSSGETAVGCRQGMIRRLGRPRTVTPVATDGPIVLQINRRLAARLRELARANGAHSVESWCEMALETYVVDHRSGKAPRPAVDQYTAQQDGEVWWKQPKADQLTEVLLTPREVAERLRISEKSVLRLVKAGTLPARVVVGKIRLCWSEVVASLPLAPASASGRASEPGVVALDLKKRLALKSQHFYRNQPGGAA